MDIHLHRTYFKESTNGALFIHDSFFGFCIELPWLNNRRNVSCIPEGTYILKARYSQKFGHHLILENVKNRTLILIHPANDALKELRGCIAPVTCLSGIGKGTSSKNLLNKLVSKCYQAFDRNEVIRLIIQS